MSDVDLSVTPRDIWRAGHRTRLKWHRARRRPTDPPFTTPRIAEGMRTGASVEVDLLVHADRGFAVLHDRRVDSATTGSGDVATLSAAELRSMHLRGPDGAPIDDQVLLLEDLAERLDGMAISSDALLQLDFKEDIDALDTRALDTFVRAVSPIARNTILSCGDSAAVARLTDAVPGIQVGYDPCHYGAADATLSSGRFDEFVANAINAAPNADMVYLENRLILGADRAGYDLIAMFHSFGRIVDGYTITRVDQRALQPIQRLLELRVDQITTDDADSVAALLLPTLPAA